MTKVESVFMDLEDRDPNTLSHHLQLSWDDVIGEPTDIRSPECAWRVSNQCFTLSKRFCYVFLSVLIAPIAACCLGCTLACLAFEHIWCLNPCLRMWKISCAMTRNFVASCAQAVIVPCCNAFGQFWTQIKVQTQILPEGPDSKEDILLV